jgi:hypothetical protein
MEHNSLWLHSIWLPWNIRVCDYIQYDCHGTEEFVITFNMTAMEHKNLWLHSIWLPWNIRVCDYIQYDCHGTYEFVITFNMHIEWNRKLLCSMAVKLNVILKWIEDYLLRTIHKAFLTCFGLNGNCKWFFFKQIKTTNAQLWYPHIYVQCV